MKLIRVQIQKIRNHSYIRLPKMIIDRFNLKDGDELEISLHSKTQYTQGDLWDTPPKEINRILFFVPNDTQSINMYNRIYVPAKYRFFFPSSGIDFIVETNVGNFRTNMTSDGYFSQGMRQWFYSNGPLVSGDLLKIRSLDEKKYMYQLICEKKQPTSK